MKFTNTVTINRQPAEVFAFLAHFENVPLWNYAGRAHLPRVASTDPPLNLLPASRLPQLVGSAARGAAGVRCVQRDVADVGCGRCAGHRARASSLNALAGRSGGEMLVASS